MHLLKTVSDIGVGVFLPLILIACGLYFTVYLKGFYVLHPIPCIKLLFSRRKSGEISPLRALSVSLAGTLGVGNIVGVAVAIVLGGAGALFWMWISALLSMILKYAEIVLAMRRRTVDKNGIHGGPMVYMRDGIGGRLGGILAAVFSALGILSSFFMGNMVQMNAASEAAHATFRIPKPVFGIVCAILTAIIILGGFRGISRVTAILIPVASTAYLYISLRAIALDFASVPMALGAVFDGAFSVSAANGGIVGSLLAGAMRQGIAKGCFTHEAGCGTAPMAHMESDTKIPAKQGLLGIFEVFFDTIVMCTLTGLVILLSDGGSLITDNGMLLVIYAFSKYYGKAAAYLITAAIAVFAFAAVICWAHYGKTCLSYLTRSRRIETLYLLLYAAVAFSGAVLPQGVAWEFTDLSVALMTGINLTALLFLRREIRDETILAGLISPKKRAEGRAKPTLFSKLLTRARALVGSKTE